MRILIISLLLGFSSTAALAEAEFSVSTAELKEVLSNPVFERYGKFAVEHVRRVEIGQAQAYFVRLMFPANRAQKGVCLEFVSRDKAWELSGHPYACED
jgi:hypothetical protein